jgi:hypothetical protein
VFDAQTDGQHLVFHFDFFNGKLRYERGFVFHVHLKVIGSKERSGFIQNGEELSGGQAVVGVVGKPGLQAAKRIRAERAAAINKLFVDQGNLRHMGVGRGFATGGEDKADIPPTMLRQRFFEFR